MEWLGDDSRAAGQLRHAHLERAEAHQLQDRLLANIELMLRNNLIHGDLSPFNILYLGRGNVRIIDFPQAIDPRMNPSASMLLSRDIENVARFFERFGIQTNWHKIAADLWRRFVLAEL
jgi:RIO kinase 1